MACGWSSFAAGSSLVGDFGSRGSAGNLVASHAVNVSPGAVWLLGGVLLALLAPLSWLGDLRSALAPYLALSTAAAVVLYLAIYLFGRFGVEPRRSAVLGVALLLRLAMLPMPPSLSDDAYRYLWDGRLLLHGENPYLVAPADVSLLRFQDELFHHQGHPETTTIYPPGAEALFAAAMALGEPFGGGYAAGYLIYKLFVVGAELASILLLLRLVDRLGLPRRFSLLYAWHPLVIVELAGQGHTDAFWTLGLALGLAGYMSGRAGGGVIGLAIGSVLRLHPLVLVPLWGRFLGLRRWCAGLVAALPVFLLFLPLLLPGVLRNYMVVLERFTNYYEFNGGFYYAVKWVLDELSIGPSNRAAGAIGVAVQLLLLLLIWWAPVRDRSVPELAWRALLVVTVQIVLAAKVHIWYFAAPLFILPLASNRMLHRAWLWVLLVAPFTYLMYLRSPQVELMQVVGLEWGGFAILAAYGALQAFRSRGTGPGRSEPDS